MTANTAANATPADRVNRRIEARIANRNFLDRLESAYVLRRTVINSPVIKRLYLRVFDHVQLNMHRISVYGRIGLQEEKVVQIEQLVRNTLDETDKYLNEKLAECDALCKANGLTAPAQHLAPMQVDVRVISPLSNRYLKLLVKGDQIVSLIELLVIEDIIGTTRGDMLTSEVRNRLRKVSAVARRLAIGVLRLVQAEMQSRDAQTKGNGAEHHPEDTGRGPVQLDTSFLPDADDEALPTDAAPRRRNGREQAESAVASADPPAAAV
jgi:hypothetical protein